MTPEEQKEAIRQAHAKGRDVAFRSVQGIGIVSARELTPEEMAEGRRQRSEKFYPDFRSRDLPPIRKKE